MGNDFPSSGSKGKSERPEGAVSTCRISTAGERQGDLGPDLAQTDTACVFSILRKVIQPLSKVHLSSHKIGIKTASNSNSQCRLNDISYIKYITEQTLSQFYLTLCDPADCSPPGSSVHGILQARTLEWAAISCSRGSFQPRGWTWVCFISCIGRCILTTSPTWEVRSILNKYSLPSPAPHSSSNIYKWRRGRW